jgi:nicotinate-nucleotide pyrophosphorylase (carboxylating)
MKIEVEVANQQHLREAIAAHADVIKLDNMSLTEIRESTTLIKAEVPGTIIEVSGDITVENVAEFAATGVDLISVSALTKLATAVDISLKIRPL